MYSTEWNEHFEKWTYKLILAPQSALLRALVPHVHHLHELSRSRQARSSSSERTSSSASGPSVKWAARPAVDTVFAHASHIAWHTACERRRAREQSSALEFEMEMGRWLPMGLATAASSSESASRLSAPSTSAARRHRTATPILN